MQMGQVVESMLYLSPDEADEFSTPLGTFSIQAHFASDGISPSMRLSGAEVYVNFDYSKKKKVELGGHGMTPTSFTLNKLGEVFSLLNQIVGNSFMKKIFDLLGQWNVTETKDGYSFTRIDSIKPDEEKKKVIQ